MIKKYSEFQDFKKFPTLGEWVESLCKDDDLIRSIVGDITRDVNPSIRVSNAVNVLDDYEKIQLVKRIESHLSGKEGELKVTTSMNVDEVIDESYGKGIFSTFLKCLTSLGGKDIKPVENTPPNFLVYFTLEGADYLTIESVFKRFKSMEILDIVYGPGLSIYYGININGNLEYGTFKDGLNKIGEFKLNRSNLNWIKISELKSISRLKSILNDLNSEDIRLLTRIKSEVNNFSPGHFDENLGPNLSGRVLTFGWCGWGRWNNGKLEDEDIEKFKSMFREKISKYNWSNKILISVTAHKFWVYLKIKLK